ncbi:hypothetical protein AAFX91_38845 [Bradyrhizobium sp. 31Argb]|uniref:hypothetical protein n=1 Tax=unclassified Bradyrhizobium TaxID=2631580 RepID=UPI00102E3743|nr:MULTISPECIES: hypothetical protein [unclassified Bradyrhizobium]MDI4232148.1 hypothetical protein [Bradyrhizobium sp. Arg237L]TAI60410.1 hypothetical protein CWO89_40795 [Bradyrhizobium sp. Leo170]
MWAFKLLGAAVALCVVSAPAMAQQVISEPGYCAQFYPYANCQNKGPGNPYTGGYQRYIGQGDGMWAQDPPIRSAGKRPRSHRSDSSAIRAR